MEIKSIIKPLFFLLLGFYFIGTGIMGYQEGEETDYILKSYLFFMGVMLVMGAYFSYIEESLSKNKK